MVRVYHLEKRIPGNRKLKPGLCDNLEGWDRVGGGREAQERGYICTPMADPN